MKLFIVRFIKLLFRVPFLRKTFFFPTYTKILLYSKILKGLREQTTLKGGIRFQLDIEDWIPSCLYFSGEYEAGEIDFMQNSLSEGDVLIDIGANIGLYTLYGAKAVGKSGSVFAFEPFSLNYDNLIKNISINHFSNIIVEKKAVSDNSTPINIYYDKNEKNSGMASSYLTEYSHEEQVESITLDQYLEDKSLNKINFIKIDIEGGEFRALRGMQKTLKKYNPVLQVEVLDEMLKKQNIQWQDVLDLLEPLGYQMYYFDKSGKLTSEQPKSSKNNYLFIKQNN